ncbi:phospholipase/carboxylesterase [Enterobacter sp. BIGb0383]|uniref:alpha/beta hydrolase n=1 Tax=unclassified Enterobacter TaxID=2608935 RepID=UPI000F4ACDCF|nr:MULTISPECIES: phospholipase [unclassified Enterobacter]ROP59465.1 phospholipase/carboxylesterase [Enterobacter sp. BIGb0383]ROS09068.1 phospholipase/carboxylesterase [Enterobacter sp. BIGb0359]
MAKKLVILLHGVGSSGSDFGNLVTWWQQSLPDVTFVTPDGTQRFDMGGAGFQWFSVNGVTEANRAERIVQARAAFDAHLQTIFSRYDVDPTQDKLILAGFSQGGIMALDVLVSDRLPLCGVIAFSARLSSPEPFNRVVGAEALIIHGKADPVIPWHEGESAAARLEALGVPVTTHFEEGVPHTISPQGLRLAQDFIQRKFLS